MDHSTRNLSVITLLTLAIFLGLDHVVQRAALADWGLVLLFLLLAVGIWFYDRVSHRGLDDSEAADSLIEPVSYEHHTDAIAIPDSIRMSGPAESTPPPAPATPVQAAQVTSSPTAEVGESVEVQEPAPTPETEQHPPTAATVTTTIEEKSAIPTSSAAPETHPDIAAQSPAGTWSPSVPTPESSENSPVPTSVRGSAPEPVAPRTSTEKVPDIQPKESSAPASAPVSTSDGPVSASAAAAANPTSPDPNLPMNAKTDTADDLKIIEGIGPKMEKALHAAGITTFAMLAGSSETQIRDAVLAAGMRFAPTIPTWAEQASFAANGDFVGLEAFQKTLVAGRKAK